ncbi:MAG: hypothetical protein HKP48_06690 [Winogradskyella sp.]|uniref:hypothetical protein n=1 Tax=Winogradskyella sp. TaxID=1883156 RepID=UPI00178D84D5|nr:hypothetical protein [Winogradskyella sp.]MBT8243650.1 hypothetical protein [Winogradskyella sp.]NNK22975.1 hypothetical protein [Winogradskyella sp.]
MKRFVELVIEIFEPLFKKYEFELAIKEFTESYSKLVFEKHDKRILMLSEKSIRDGNYYEFTIGNSLCNETNSFDDYHISVNRLYKIIKRKGKDFNPFPSNEKEALRYLEKSKQDFLSCALFFLETDDELFDKVLRLKGIRK